MCLLVLPLHLLLSDLSQELSLLLQLGLVALLELLQSNAFTFLQSLQLLRVVLLHAQTLMLLILVPLMLHDQLLAVG